MILYQINQNKIWSDTKAVDKTNSHIGSCFIQKLWSNHIIILTNEIQIIVITGTTNHIDGEASVAIHFLSIDLNQIAIFMIAKNIEIVIKNIAKSIQTAEVDSWCDIAADQENQTQIIVNAKIAIIWERLLCFDSISSSQFKIILEK